MVVDGGEAAPAFPAETKGGPSGVGLGTSVGGAFGTDEENVEGKDHEKQYHAPDDAADYGAFVDGGRCS
jgi:hypothetical protein